MSSGSDEQFPEGGRAGTGCFLNLARTGQLIEERVLRILRRHGLTTATAQILRILDEDGEALPPHVISRKLVVSRATVTGLLDVLERKGLISRTPHPGDRRMLLIELTRTAREALAEVQPAIQRMEAECMNACLSRPEQEQLVNLLRRIQDALLASGSGA